MNDKRTKSSKHLPLEKRGPVKSLRTASALGVCALTAVLLLGCAPKSVTIPDPVPDDRRHVPPPKSIKIYHYADGFDKQVARPVERFFDLSRYFRKMGGAPKQAFNVDAFDDVRNSSWFTRRNAWHPMTLDEIRRGPDTEHGPSLNGKWTVIAAKAEGVTPGFTIKDSDGGRYVIKFDPPGYAEMSTGAEVVSTKLFYAAGFNTPENYLVTFDPSILELSDDVKIKDKTGEKRKMTTGDLDEILDRLSRRPDGQIRAVASKFLSGKLLGPYRYHGTRKDDPNDVIPHEHRRELRGLRMIAAWLNHYDTKAGNSLDIYIEEDGRSFVKHYLIDFGSTLGSQGDEPMPLWTGYENTFDQKQVVKNTLGLGIYQPGWEQDRAVQYTSVGLYDWQKFKPMKYRFIVPNQAFVNLTNRDGYWGAKIVTSFTDEQLRVAVEEAAFSDPGATDLLHEVLMQRRDIVGRYWFERMTPLDRPTVVMPGLEPGGVGDDLENELRCVDLAVERGLVQAADRTYEVGFWKNGKSAGEATTMSHPLRIRLPDIDPDQPLEVRIRSNNIDGKWAEWLSVLLTHDGSAIKPTIVAFQHRD